MTQPRTFYSLLNYHLDGKISPTVPNIIRVSLGFSAGCISIIKINVLPHFKFLLSCQASVQLLVILTRHVQRHLNSTECPEIHFRVTKHVKQFPISMCISKQFPGFIITTAKGVRFCKLQQIVSEYMIHISYLQITFDLFSLYCRTCHKYHTSLLSVIKRDKLFYMPNPHLLQ